MLIGYARVSTMDQNPALQKDALRAAGCKKIFTEKASGSHRNRPQLQAALDYLREGDTLVIWKLSRLARSLTQIIKTTRDIGERGIALKVLTQNIDTHTSEGRLFFHMTAAFDGFQRELIVENTRTGLQAAAKRGRLGGRPKVMNEKTIKNGNGGFARGGYLTTPSFLYRARERARERACGSICLPNSGNGGICPHHPDDGIRASNGSICLPNGSICPPNGGVVFSPNGGVCSPPQPDEQNNP